MKTINLILIAIIMSITNSIAQNDNFLDFYVSKQTGEFFPNLTGFGTKVNDQYENGVSNVWLEGPILGGVDPKDFSIAENETKSWTGWLKPDVDAAPNPGNSVHAKLVNDFIVKYSRPIEMNAWQYELDMTRALYPYIDGVITSESTSGPRTCEGCYFHPAFGSSYKHEMVFKEGKLWANIKVHSVNVEITKKKAKVNKKDGSLEIECEAQGYPKGGQYQWEIDGEFYNGKTVTIIIYACDWDIKHGEDIPIKVKYITHDVSFTAESEVYAKPLIFRFSMKKTIKINPKRRHYLLAVWAPKDCTIEWACFGTCISHIETKNYRGKSYFYFKAKTSGVAQIKGYLKYCGKVVAQKTCNVRVYPR